MDFLDKIFWGNTVEDWGIAVLIIVGALVVNKLIRLLHDGVLKKIAARSKSQFDDILLDALEKPVMLGVILGGVWFAAENLEMSNRIRGIIEAAYRILIVLNITWFASKFATSLVSEYGVRINSRLIPLMKRTVLVVIWVIGIVTALNNVGVQIATILGVLSVCGVSVAL
ncbi:MAG: mechanosensitive ion channel family protein, partial [Prevotellaceae bacterium]|nr:mechanosensitive ion channel family protein [Prevotellaceae bacterium]